MDLREAEEVCPHSRKEKTESGREDEEEGRFLEPERWAEGWRLGSSEEGGTQREEAERERKAHR